MHTIAPPQSKINVDMVLRGILTRNAEVRSKVLDDDGHTVPVLCVEFTTDTSSHMPVHAEQTYKPDQHALAEKHAKALRRGLSVTVHASLVGFKLLATNASAIDLDDEVDGQGQAKQGALL